MVFSPGTNFYFNNFTNSQEQLLIENLIIESIKIYGLDMYYLPRTINNLDPIYGADDSSSYDAAWNVEMYIKNVDGFAGDGDLLSKFGLEIRDQITFVVSRRIFSEAVGDVQDQIRPNEGDLIFFPLNQKIFRINFVEHESIFYQMGSLQVYELKCELFEYSGEVFNTGIEYVDGLTSNYSMDLLENGSLLTEEGYVLVDEIQGIPLGFEQYESAFDTSIGSENDYYQEKGLQIIDFSEFDPFSEGENW